MVTLCVNHHLRAAIIMSTSYSVGECLYKAMAFIRYVQC